MKNQDFWDCKTLKTSSKPQNENEKESKTEEVVRMESERSGANGKETKTGVRSWPKREKWCEWKVTLVELCRKTALCVKKSLHWRAVLPVEQNKQSNKSEMVYTKQTNERSIER